MINNDNEHSTNSVTSKPSSTTTTVEETDSTMMSPINPNPTDEDLNQNESQEEPNEDDEFIRITAAHQMLTEGTKTNDYFSNKTQFSIFSPNI